MDKNKIPASIQHLIPHVEKWGITDDPSRDEAIENASNEELTLLVNSITDDDADALDIWFCDPEQTEEPSDEYIKLSVFFMAYEYAKRILKDRKL